MVFVRRNEKRPVDYALVQRLQREVVHLRGLLAQLGGGKPGQSGGGGSDDFASAIERLEAELRAEREKGETLQGENKRLLRLLNDPHTKHYPPVSFSGPPMPSDAVASSSPTRLPSVSRGVRADADLARELEALQERNRVLEHALDDVHGASERFFTFEIEEDELRSALSSVVTRARQSKPAAPPLAPSGARATMRGGPSEVAPARRQPPSSRPLRAATSPLRVPTPPAPTAPSPGASGGRPTSPRALSDPGTSARNQQREERPLRLPKPSPARHTRSSWQENVADAGGTGGIESAGGTQASAPAGAVFRLRRRPGDREPTGQQRDWIDKGALRASRAGARSESFHSIVTCSRVVSFRRGRGGEGPAAGTAQGEG
jgi:hypothetical protein